MGILQQIAAKNEQD